MKLAISQPTFLPWCGYIGLIDYVDKFVFLDDVQFDKRGWQQRNYIKLNNDKHLITVPIKSKNKRFQKINEAEIDHNTNYIDQHKKKFFTAIQSQNSTINIPKIYLKYTTKNIRKY